MNKLKLNLIVLLFLFSVTRTSAHPADVSSIALIKGESGKWTVQLISSMTAFQYEVRNAFGEDSYASPEEFNKLLLDHLRKHISLRINSKDLSLGNGLVKLGHATAVIFELNGVPDQINQVSVKNESFKTMHNSRSIFTISKEGLTQEKIILNKENNYQVNVSLENNRVLIAEEASFNNDRLMIIIALTIVCLLGLLLFKRHNDKKKIFELSNARLEGLQ